MKDEYQYENCEFSEIKKNMDDFPPSAFVTIWKPKDPNNSTRDEEINDHLKLCDDCNQKFEGDDFVSAIKMWVLNHIVDSNDHAMRLVSLVPSNMSRIFLQGMIITKKPYSYENYQLIQLLVFFCLIQ